MGETVRRCSGWTGQLSGLRRRLGLHGYRHLGESALSVMVSCTLLNEDTDRYVTMQPRPFTSLPTRPRRRTSVDNVGELTPLRRVLLLTAAQAMSAAFSTPFPAPPLPLRRRLDYPRRSSSPCATIQDTSPLRLGPLPGSFRQHAMKQGALSFEFGKQGVSKPVVTANQW